MNFEDEIREQELFEGTPLSDEDKKLYSLLFDELSNEPELEIKPDFAPAVAQRLAKKRRKEAIRENFLFAAAITGILLLTIGGLQIVKGLSQSQTQLQNTNLLAPGLLLAGMLIIFQVIDKRYIKDRRIKKLN